MAQFGLPVLYAILIWWFSTGLIALLDGLPRRTFGWSLAGATVLAGAGLWAVGWGAQTPTVIGSLAGFTGAILVWGWSEAAFLLGLVTGPRRTACPPGCRGWRRVRLAVQTILWHELALLGSAAAVAAVSWDAVNPVGLWTFALLWVMRVSAKLNVFLGVPNPGEAFLPAHLAYLGSFFRRRSMNPLFPLSVTGATVTAMMLGLAALTPDAEPFSVVAFVLLATFAALALLEHWMMVLPLPAAGLWSWFLGSRADTAGPAPIPGHGPNLAPSSSGRQS